MNRESKRNYLDSGFAGFVDFTWKFEHRAKRLTLPPPTLFILINS